MSEHHPITDQMLAEKNATGHSIFGPSSAHRWMRCPRSLIAGHLAGDNPSYYAAEGSVAHWLAEVWLTEGYDVAYSYLGSIQTKDGFEIEVTEEMISYLEEYVSLVESMPGTHYTEVKVDLSKYTPVPSFGTSDHISASWQKLKVKDLKYGKVWVDAEENEQGQAYALGAFEELDWLYDFQEIEIQICQPRRDNYDSWTITREQLLEFGERYRDAAHAAWDAEAPYNPDPIACEYCPARFGCPALAAVKVKIAAASFDDLDDLEMSPERAVAVIDNEMISGDPVLPAYNTVPVERLAQIYEWRPILEKYFREMYDYLLGRLEMGVEVPGQKLGMGRAGNRKWIDEKDARKFLRGRNVADLDMWEQKFISPAAASTLLKTSLGGSKKHNDAILAHLVSQSPGKVTMIPSSDKREEIGSAVSAFDDDVEAIGNS
jgi:hypothetical protein